MAAPNMPDPFFADLVAVFPGNAWQTNAVNNFVPFRERETLLLLFSMLQTRRLSSKDKLKLPSIYPQQSK